ncbi:hypothetical protein AAG570_004264 [Ranatra chinensis]|uniref:Uncharacterized protein n=1 Tax=Ranatra chinensis TaxID=642074 RepID=A0ABD0Y3E9_9HEMI
MYYLKVLSADEGKREHILESRTTTEEWNIELERVLPSLKVSIKSGYGGDWRSHYAAMKQEHNGLSSRTGKVVSKLGKMATQLTMSLDTISSREQLINRQLDPLLQEYRTLRDELSAVNERYKEVNGGVVARQRQLDGIEQTMEQVRLQTEERAATMSDGSPLIQIKKAIKDIKSEMKLMDINIAMVEHNIFQSKLKRKALASSLAFHAMPVI